MFKDNEELMSDYTVIKGDIEKPCVVCKEPTAYIDYCFEVRVCSTECLMDFENQLYADA